MTKCPCLHTRKVSNIKYVMTRITNLLTPVTFLLAPTLAAIASNGNNTGPNIAKPVNASSNTDGFCYGNGYDDERRTSYAHCQRAANLVPEGVMPGSFHMHGADDAFRLPRVVRYESCMVVVSLVSPDEQPDQCTWHKIMSGAAQVSSRCRSPGIKDLTTGGFVIVGNQGTFMISMEKYREDPLSLGYAGTGVPSLGIGLGSEG